MNAEQTWNGGGEEMAVATKHGWWVVATGELADLWLGTRAVVVLLLFSVLLGVMAFLLATNTELRLTPPREMLFMILQATIAISLFVGLSIGADSISGERERATLESLLLTPVGRRGIVFGKYLAAVSVWPVAICIATIYLLVLTPNPEALRQTLFWGVLLGSLLVIGFSGFGILTSFWANSNKTSLSMSLIVYLIFLLPTQFPGNAQTGAVGRFVKRINPLEATNQFLEKVIVNNRTPEEMASWLWAPILFALIVLVLLFWYAAPTLQLEGSMPKMSRPRSTRSVNLLLLLVLLTLFAAPWHSARAEESGSSSSILGIAIDATAEIVKTGDEIDFSTEVTYDGEETSQEMLVAMNIVNLGEGDPVDPEDWSPERTQSIEPLAKGETAVQDWTINAILEGDYMVYMVVLPSPESPETTSQPVASMGIHLTVEPYTDLNPGGVMPFVIGIPIALLGVLGILIWRRRRSIV